MAATTALHIAMYPWFAFGHLTPYLHLSNKLAKKGHIISFFIPTKTLTKLQHLNLFPDLITFISINVPHVDGLPLGAETTFDVPSPPQISLLMAAMDRTEPDIERLLQDTRPDIIFFDFTHWMPKLARKLGIKSVNYWILSAATVAFNFSPSRQLCGHELTEADHMHPPPGYPNSDVKLHVHEARALLSRRRWRFGGDILFFERMFTSASECDVIGFKTCKEVDEDLINYLESDFKKPVLLSGPVIPEPPTTSLEEKWEKWLSGFKAGSVIYCAFGSECILKKDQFQELLLGFEISGFPFFAALKPPSGSETVEEALPEGFKSRVGGRGVVHGGWVQQQNFLKHPSIGCFVTHCGAGSLLEGLISKCQLVLLAQVELAFARMLSSSVKVGVEVERGEEDGLFTRESVCKAVTTVMNEGNDTGEEIRTNHAKMRDILLDKNLDHSYIDSFSHSLEALVASNPNGKGESHSFQVFKQWYYI